MADGILTTVRVNKYSAVEFNEDGAEDDGNELVPSDVLELSDGD